MTVPIEEMVPLKPRGEETRQGLLFFQRREDETFSKRLLFCGKSTIRNTMAITDYKKT